MQVCCQAPPGKERDTSCPRARALWQQPEAVENLAFCPFLHPSQTELSQEVGNVRLPTKPANTDPCSLLSAALVASTAAVDAQPLIIMQHPRPRKTLGLGVTISMVNVGCLTCVVCALRAHQATWVGE